MPAYDIERLKRRIAGIRFEDNPALVRQKSRDFYWYSPVLKRQLAEVTGDIVVAPTNETELVEVMAAAFELQIPLTPRGGGEGKQQAHEPPREPGPRSPRETAVRHRATPEIGPARL